MQKSGSVGMSDVRNLMELLQAQGLSFELQARRREPFDCGLTPSEIDELIVQAGHGIRSGVRPLHYTLQSELIKLIGDAKSVRKVGAKFWEGVESILCGLAQVTNIIYAAGPDRCQVGEMRSTEHLRAVAAELLEVGDRSLVATGLTRRGKVKALHGRVRLYRHLLDRDLERLTRPPGAEVSARAHFRPLYHSLQSSGDLLKDAVHAVPGLSALSSIGGAEEALEQLVQVATCVIDEMKQQIDAFGRRDAFNHEEFIGLRLRMLPLYNELVVATEALSDCVGKCGGDEARRAYSVVHTLTQSAAELVADDLLLLSACRLVERSNRGQQSIVNFCFRLLKLVRLMAHSPKVNVASFAEGLDQPALSERARELLRKMQGAAAVSNQQVELAVVGMPIVSKAVRDLMKIPPDQCTTAHMALPLRQFITYIFKDPRPGIELYNSLFEARTSYDLKGLTFDELRLIGRCNWLLELQLVPLQTVHTMVDLVNTKLALPEVKVPRRRRHKVKKARPPLPSVPAKKASSPLDTLKASAPRLLTSQLDYVLSFSDASIETVCEQLYLLRQLALAAPTGVGDSSLTFLEGAEDLTEDFCAVVARLEEGEHPLASFLYELITIHREGLEGDTRLGEIAQRQEAFVGHALQVLAECYKGCKAEGEGAYLLAEEKGAALEKISGCRNQITLLECQTVSGQKDLLARTLQRNDHLHNIELLLDRLILKLDRRSPQAGWDRLIQQCCTDAVAAAAAHGVQLEVEATTVDGLLKLLRSAAGHSVATRQRESVASSPE